MATKEPLQTGGYPDTQATAGTGASVNVDPLEQKHSGLVVGPNIKMKGVEITDCDSVLVEGSMEAIFETRLVQIAEDGVVMGAATMDVAEVWGRFEGELTARKQLIIYPTGRVSGHVQCGKIKIEEGGELCGRVSMLPQPRK